MIFLGHDPIILDPAPEPFHDHLLWVFPFNPMSMDWLNHFPRKSRVYRLEWGLCFASFAFNRVCDMSFFSDLDRQREHFLMISATAKLYPNGIKWVRLISPNFFSDTPSSTCEITWYHMNLHDLARYYMYTNDHTCNMFHSDPLINTIQYLRTPGFSIWFFNFPRPGMIEIPALKMVMTGGWFVALFYSHENYTGAW